MTVAANLYLVRKRRGIFPFYDAMDSCVVCAETYEGARKYAADAHGDEGVDMWYDNTLTSCELIGIALSQTPPGMVCRDFNAG